MKANEVEALSMLLSLNAIDVPSIEKMSTELLRLALPTDAAECALYLLNHLEELRRAKHNAQKAARAAAEEETEELRQLKLQNNNKRQRRERELLGGSWGPDNLENNNKQIRDDYIQESEAHCGEAPNSRALLTLAAEAMALCDGDGKPTPAMRCTRALLLQAHRLRKQTPQTGARILDTNEEPLVDSNGQAAIPWPSYPVDLPAGFLTKGGVGGLDLSLGGEAMPLQWINEVDDAVPPPIVFVRRCIDVDVHPNWRTHPCRPCNATMDAAEGERRQPLDGCRCVAQAKFPPSKPEAYCECNWACAHEENDRRPCTSQCARRTLQRGAACRLQVFRHPMKGWCLRTLTPIKEGAFVMEYVAERVTPKRAEERQRDDYNVETYLMDQTRAAKGMALDALLVRNHAAFAAFTCTHKKRNMKKIIMYTNHWDNKVPHVGFFATRDIEPGEELLYLRTDEEPKAGGTRICGCQQEGCSGYI